jgi:hypothetical protein
LALRDNQTVSHATRGETLGLLLAMVASVAIPIGVVYIVTLIYPAVRPGFLVALFIASGLLFAFIFHQVVVAPCRATTKLHTVTDNMGRFYQTEYKDSGEWCLWVRGTF